jgi:membrane associated rhomboid family serine protease
VISIVAFSQPQITLKYQFNAWQIFHRKEYRRLVSHAFFHAGWMHLLINMFVLYSFGRAVLYYFNTFFTGMTDLRYLLLFITAIPVSSLYSLYKERDNPHYNAIGASGAVSAVVFASIFFDPYNPILFFGILPIPGIIFGFLYLFYSKYMSGKNLDNVGHDAHFWGALYGFVFPLFYDPSLIFRFFNQLVSF